MMYCKVESGEIVGGPWLFESAQIKPHLPTNAVDDPVYLASSGLVRFTYADEFSPLGYAPPVLENNGTLAVSYPLGTLEERQAAALIQWRESMSIPRWKGRAYLASQPPVEDGPLAQFSGTTLMGQVDAFVAASFGPVQRERYLGADPWRRNDAMIAGMGTLLGLSDEQIDDWFKSAESFA